MKKITLILALLFLAFTNIKAQISKGSFSLGGSVAYEKVKIKSALEFNNVTSPDYSFVPKVGFGLSHNWMLGVLGTYDHDHVVSKGTNFTNELESEMYRGGVFARKFFPMNQKFGVFGEANLVYGSGNTSQVTNGGPMEKWKQHSYSSAIYPGIYFKPVKNIFLEATIGKIGYEYISAIPPDGPNQKDHGFTGSFLNNWSIGLFFIL